MNLLPTQTITCFWLLFAAATSHAMFMPNPMPVISRNVPAFSSSAGAMYQDEKGGQNFAQIINATLPDYFPAQENAGRGGWIAEDAVPHFPQWLAQFPGRFVTLNHGSNDANTGVTPEAFYSHYESMVQAVLAAGKIPIIPTIQWFRNERAERNVPPLNAALAVLKQNYPRVLDGPDFWTFFSSNQHLISSDDLHPSDEGDLEYRRLWAEKMLEVVYNSVLFADGFESGGPGAWFGMTP